MNSKHPFLKRLRIRGCQKHIHTTSLGFIKDALITQVQPMYDKEIVDVDLDLPDPIDIVYYTRKKGK